MEITTWQFSFGLGFNCNIAVWKARRPVETKNPKNPCFHSIDNHPPNVLIKAGLICFADIKPIENVFLWWLQGNRNPSADCMIEAASYQCNFGNRLICSGV
jgi:hypothetical protein